jgi:hypothetical protein
MSEQQIRNLRDIVYDHPISDGEWEKCRDGWMKPENQQWLLEKSKRPLARY